MYPCALDVGFRQKKSGRQRKTTGQLLAVHILGPKDLHQVRIRSIHLFSAVWSIITISANFSFTAR
jgi:hypothetical protein